MDAGITCCEALWETLTWCMGLQSPGTGREEVWAMVLVSCSIRGSGIGVLGWNRASSLWVHVLLLGEIEGRGTGPVCVLSVGERVSMCVDACVGSKILHSTEHSIAG
jgi:hypothetical protein